MGNYYNKGTDYRSKQDKNMNRIRIKTRLKDSFQVQVEFFLILIGNYCFMAKIWRMRGFGA